MSKKSRCKPCRWICLIIFLAVMVLVLSRRRQRPENRQARTIDL